MAKRKLTRNDFIGLRMIRPEANSYPTTNSLSYDGYYYPNGYGYGPITTATVRNTAMTLTVATCPKW